MNVGRASIIGLGNILKGDFGIGCYVLDALGQEPLGDAVEMVYLAENSSYIEAYMQGTDFSAIVQALSLGGAPGNIHCWDVARFQQNRAWLSETTPIVTRIAQALSRREFLEGSCGDILFLWIEPATTEGFGVSPEVQTAMRKAIRIVKQNLFARGFLAEKAYQLSYIHQLAMLDIKV